MSIISILLVIGFVVWLFSDMHKTAKKVKAGPKEDPLDDSESFYHK